MNSFFVKGSLIFAQLFSLWSNMNYAVDISCDD